MSDWGIQPDDPDRPYGPQNTSEELMGLLIQRTLQQLIPAIEQITGAQPTRGALVIDFRGLREPDDDDEQGAIVVAPFAMGTLTDYILADDDGALIDRRRGLVIADVLLHAAASEVRLGSDAPSIQAARDEVHAVVRADLDQLAARRQDDAA